jgi:hypothetical protein
VPGNLQQLFGIVAGLAKPYMSCCCPLQAGPEGAIALAASLKVNPVLAYLNLSGTSIGEGVLTLLSWPLFEHDPSRFDPRTSGLHQHKPVAAVYLTPVLVGSSQSGLRPRGLRPDCGRLPEHC